MRKSPGSGTVREGLERLGGAILLEVWARGGLGASKSSPEDQNFFLSLPKDKDVALSYCFRPCLNAAMLPVMILDQLNL